MEMIAGISSILVDIVETSGVLKLNGCDDEMASRHEVRVAQNILTRFSEGYVVQSAVTVPALCPLGGSVYCQRVTTLTFSRVEKPKSK